MIVPTVELDTSSQIYKVLQRLDEYDLKFAKQERTNTELQSANEELRRTNEELRRTNEDLQMADEVLQKTIAAQQKTIAELSTNVARVSYPSSLSISQRNLLNHPS